jgi:hypothetical protein
VKPYGCVPALALLGVLAVSTIAAGQVVSSEAPEKVIALSYRGSHRAYPLRLFADRRIVNDVVGSMEIAVFHDPELNLSTAWFRTVLGEPIEFSGTAAGTTAEDLTTITRWDMTTGVAVGGNLAGQRLVPIPFTTTGWREWVAAHPQAQVYRPEGQ